MPLQKLQFKPGLNRDQTNYTYEGGWNNCDKIPFRSGYPQKIGGWLRYGTFTVAGICRQVFNWITTASDNYLALGTSKKLYIEAGQILNDLRLYERLLLLRLLTTALLRSMALKPLP